MKKFVLVTEDSSEEEIMDTIVKILNNESELYVGKDADEAESSLIENVAEEDRFDKDYIQVEVTVTITHTGSVPDPLIRWFPVSKKAK